MSHARAFAGLVGTVFIAAVVAYSVSAPRNINAAMDMELDALGGQSINDQVAETQAKAEKERCERFTRLSQQAWDRAVDQGTEDRDAEQLDEMERLAQHHCSG